jgi:hypothetical protein
MAIRPTPTQAENDLAASGNNVLTKTADGSPLQPATAPEVPGTNPPPVITTIAPTTGAAPNFTLVVNGSNFTGSCRIVFNSVVMNTNVISTQRLSTPVSGFTHAPGNIPVKVHDPVASADSNIVQFDWTGTMLAADESPRRRSKEDKL